MKSHRQWAGVLVLGIAVTATSACGGDAAPNRAEYRQRVNAECRDARDAVGRITPAAGSDPAKLIASGRRALARQRQALSSIADLSRPASERRRITRWLKLVRSALDSVGASLDAQARIDLAAADRANAKGAALVQQADVLARQLRFHDCVT